MKAGAAEYAPRRRSRSAFATVRGLNYHLRCWSARDAPLLVLLHGGRDASITFQFLVDALEDDWFAVAPDWRGHGDTEWTPQGYWFQDYLADLDALLGEISPSAPVRLVGHSLGGNVACLYAGLRPQRVSRLVSLDGFGIPDGDPRTAPSRFRAWLDGWADPPQTRAYGSLADMATRLTKANPRLDPGRALFLARHLSRSGDDGFRWSFDPWHKIPFPNVHRFAEWAACFADVTAPVLWVGSGVAVPPGLAAEPGGPESRLRFFRDARFERIEGAGHNLHHDAPEAVAALIEPFLREGT